MFLSVIRELYNHYLNRFSEKILIPLKEILCQLASNPLNSPFLQPCVY